MSQLFEGLPESWEGRGEAIELIRTHLDAARRQAAFYQGQFPHLDVEAKVMTALYLAAVTYRPGKSSFYSWFNWKIFGQLSVMRRTLRRKPHQPAPLSVEQFDSRYYYTDDRG